MDTTQPKTISAQPQAAPPERRALKSASVLAVLLVVFVSLQSLLPLRTAIQIGADEGFNLAKATLCLKGYKLYTDIWNDQPPLHTFLVTQTLKHVTASILAPRLLTAVFAAVLLSALFLIALRVAGLLAAALATAFLIASPGFMELSSSCMLEIPGLVPGVAALSLLLAVPRMRWHLREIVAGALFGIAFMIKPNSLPLLPLAALALCLPPTESLSSICASVLPPVPKRPEGSPPSPSPFSIFPSLRICFGFRASDFGFSLPLRALRGLCVRLFTFLASLAITYVTLGLLIDHRSYFTHFQQSWTSHLGPVQSLEYGSPNDHPFDWSILLKNWDTTLPALLGISLSFLQIRKRPIALVPVAWLCLSLAVFAIHRPWWPYYYIHIAVPLSLCAALGIDFVLHRASIRPAWPWVTLLAVYVVCAGPWMGARIYLQITGIRNSPQTYTALVLTEIERYKPFTQYLYASEPVYSFHAGIPMPPDLAVVSLKRMWSGGLTNARIADEMRSLKPGLILVANDTRELPFTDLIQAEYRLVYQDAAHNLYVHKAVLAKAKL